MTQVQTEYEYPPAEWMRDCDEPQLRGEKNRDLMILAEQQDASLQACNADKRALREWREQTESTNQNSEDN